MRSSKLWGAATVKEFFYYETTRLVSIPSVFIQCVYHGLQTGILAYIIVYVMWYHRGYQEFDRGFSGVTAKIKGVAADFDYVSDAADYVIPPQQNSAMFVATHIERLAGQRLANDCAPDYRACQPRPTTTPFSTPFSTASSTASSTGAHNHRSNSSEPACTRGFVWHAKFSDNYTDYQENPGFVTGRCRERGGGGSGGACEITDWCHGVHTSVEHRRGRLIERAASNFTILLKNSVVFTKFDVHVRNILPWMTNRFLKTCRHESHHAQLQFCPIFRLGDMVRRAAASSSNTRQTRETQERIMADIWRRGAIILIHIDWSCNLDWSLEHCTPTYSFERLDEFRLADDTRFESGQQVYHAHHYTSDSDESERRMLMMANGVQIFFAVSSVGGKFSPFWFSMNLGSGLALLAIASLVADWLIGVMDTRQNNEWRRATTTSRLSRTFIVVERDAAPPDKPLDKALNRVIGADHTRLCTVRPRRQVLARAMRPPPKLSFQS